MFDHRYMNSAAAFTACNIFEQSPFYLVSFTAVTWGTAAYPCATFLSLVWPITALVQECRTFSRDGERVCQCHQNFQSKCFQRVSGDHCTDSYQGKHGIISVLERTYLCLQFHRHRSGVMILFKDVLTDKIVDMTVSRPDKRQNHCLKKLCFIYL